MASSCEYGYELLSSIKSGEFLDQILGLLALQGL